MWNITGAFLVNWKFNLQFQWAAPLNLPVTWQWSLTFSSSLSINFLQIQQLFVKKMFFFYTHGQIFVKVLVHYFSAVLVLLKNCFNKFISCIFSSINSKSLSKPYINTNNFVSKTTRSVILIFFCVTTFIAFNTP